MFRIIILALVLGLPSVARSDIIDNFLLNLSEYVRVSNQIHTKYQKAYPTKTFTVQRIRGPVQVILTLTDVQGAGKLDVWSFAIKMHGLNTQCFNNDLTAVEIVDCECVKKIEDKIYRGLIADAFYMFDEKLSEAEKTKEEAKNSDLET